MNDDLRHQAARPTRLKALLDLDGRTEPGHPYRGTYTGLARPITRLMELEQSFLFSLSMLGDRFADIERRLQSLESNHSEPEDELTA